MHLLTLAALLGVAIYDIAGNCPIILYRTEWGAQKPAKVDQIDGQPNKILVKEMKYQYPFCRNTMTLLEQKELKHSDDITCNFVFGYLGDVCEARGWYRAVNDTKTVVLCVMGQFHHDVVVPALNDSLTNFFTCPDTKLILDPNYIITTPRDHSVNVENPGQNLYNLVRRLRHWQPGPASASNVNNSAVDCPSLFKRSDWNAKPALSVTPFTTKPSKVLVKETGHIHKSCTAIIGQMQSTDMEKHESPDVDCNFVFGLGGDMCEGRGWKNSVINNEALVLCVSGDFHRYTMTDGLKGALTEFFNCTMTSNLLDPNYKIITLRDTLPKSLNPGYNLYRFLTKLPHYSKAARTDKYNSLWKKEESVWEIGK